MVSKILPSVWREPQNISYVHISNQETAFSHPLAKIVKLATLVQNSPAFEVSPMSYRHLQMTY